MRCGNHEAHQKSEGRRSSEIIKMDRKKHKKYFDILELDLDASLAEIRKAYLDLKKLYSTDFFLTSPISDDFPDERRGDILKQIDDAYSHILALLDKDGNIQENGEGISYCTDCGHDQYIAKISAFSGKILKEVRERMGVELHEISRKTNISMQQLENIELENFQKLPPAVYLRGFVTAFAEYLTLDPHKAAEDIMKRYKIWKDMKGSDK
jgi:hypothetical protein